MAYLYRHIRLDKNEPFYIGIGTDSEGYYKRAKSKDGRNKLWRDVVAKTKYDIEIILDNIEVEVAHKKEIEFIALYGKKTQGGILCNLTDGGEGWPGLKHSIETKRRISEKNKGIKVHNKGMRGLLPKEKHGMYGKKITPDHRRKLKDFKKGNIPWNIGKKRGLDWEVTEKMKNAQAKRRIKILQYDQRNILIGEYESLFQAQIMTGVRRGNIFHCLKGNRNSSGGYKWSYAPLE